MNDFPYSKEQIEKFNELIKFYKEKPPPSGPLILEFFGSEANIKKYLRIDSEDEKAIDILKDLGFIKKTDLTKRGRYAYRHGFKQAYKKFAGRDYDKCLQRVFWLSMSILAILGILGYITKCN